MEKERRQISKQEKQFDAEFQDLMQSSIQENISSADTVKPLKFVRDKNEDEHSDKESAGLEPSNKGNATYVPSILFLTREEDCAMFPSG